MYRRATLADSWDWWQIRNDTEALFWSNNSRKITLEEHDAWFSRAHRPPSQHIMLVYADPDREALNAPVVNAYGRIQLETQAEVSFGVAADSRGKGIGRGMLESLEREGRQAGVQRLVAYVHPGNTPSLRAFMNQGYVLGGNPGFTRLDKKL